MIGRGAIGNPWIFSRARALLGTGRDPGPPGIYARIAAYLELLDETVAEKGEPRGVYEMRKHLSGYLKEVAHISALRAKLMEQTTQEGVRQQIAEFVRFLEGGPAPAWAGLSLHPAQFLPSQAHDPLAVAPAEAVRS
jgi:tRNA-dihydrouridine synthase